jgi:cell pole-organizing protein PopZ
LIPSARAVSNGQAFMSAQAKPNEPSMEEILASIRRIISDDEAKPEEAAPVVQEEAAAAPATPLDDDVLDLGAEAALVAAPPPAPAPEPVPPPAEEQDDSDVAFLDEPEVAAALPESVIAEPVAAPAAPSPQAPPPQAPTVDMASLLSDQASSAVTNAFGQLASTVLSNNARTLEDLVKDMLKPMLKTWLDDNLPTMVERLVRAEIERVARGGRN